MTSTVWPEWLVTTSPGRCALSPSMFSTRPTRPTTFTFALRPASAAMAPTTAAAPAMSHFMSSMPPAGLMEMPPLSKVTPLPTKATGLPSPPAPCQDITTMRGSRALPSETPISMPKPSFSSSAGPNTSTATPSCSRLRQRSAISAGNSTLAGSLARSRARNTPRATGSSAAHSAVAPAGSPHRTRRAVSLGLSSAFSLVR